ncbi:hypothetical protein JVT61DRAFT_6061 [Boletus reticuloceps]|uniref:Uncharacterized protein n=1 Tax=Boletus reticuloceps TaxID=495285 RepID=A0A8I3A8F2_9AGAM|nr:hypothetical protein JVT61DRAFT_6061 [Boletus reticuloceps]
MTTGVFSVFSSIFGFVVAAISLLAFVVNMCRSHLPSNKIKVLESLLDETETCFKKAIEDGLLTEPPFVLRTESGLTILKTRAQGLRSRAHNATDLRQDYAEFLRGTSTAIERLKSLLVSSLSHVEAELRCLLSRHPARKGGLDAWGRIPFPEPHFHPFCTLALNTDPARSFFKSLVLLRVLLLFKHGVEVIHHVPSIKAVSHSKRVLLQATV